MTTELCKGCHKSSSLEMVGGYCWQCKPTDKKYIYVTVDTLKEKHNDPRIDRMVERSAKDLAQRLEDDFMKHFPERKV